MSRLDQITDDLGAIIARLDDLENFCLELSARLGEYEEEEAAALARRETRARIRWSDDT